jgi:hypothetical protein
VTPAVQAALVVAVVVVTPIVLGAQEIPHLQAQAKAIMAGQVTLVRHDVVVAAAVLAQLAQVQMVLPVAMVVLEHCHQLLEHLLKERVAAVAVLEQLLAEELRLVAAVLVALMAVLAQMELQILAVAAVEILILVLELVVQVLSFFQFQPQVILELQQAHPQSQHQGQTQFCLSQHLALTQHKGNTCHILQK